MDDPRFISACEEFEKLGESAVRSAITTGEFKVSNPSIPRHSFAVEWCRLKDLARSESSIADIRRDVRIDRYIAIAAVIIAAIAAHKEIKWLITSLISWPH
jgi:hypothetical protein